MGKNGRFRLLVSSCPAQQGRCAGAVACETGTPAAKAKKHKRVPVGFTIPGAGACNPARCFYRTTCAIPARLISALSADVGACSLACNADGSCLSCPCRHRQGVFGIGELGNWGIGERTPQGRVEERKRVGCQRALLPTARSWFLHPPLLDFRCVAA